MVELLFWTLVALLALALWKVFRRPERIYAYPYFMATVFAIFILPQAVSLLRFPGAAPGTAVQNVLLMTCLCLGACLGGEHFATNRPAVRKIFTNLDPQRLWHGGLLFAACGLGFSYVLAHMEVQTDEYGGWTGPATIYGFFQQLCFPGFAICLTVALSRPSMLSLGAALVAAIVPVQSILFGRREPAALFLLTIGLTFYFQFGLKPSRWLLALLVVFGVLAIPATATYRRFQRNSDWQSVRQMQLINNFKEFVNDESVLELRNAAMLIEATRRSGQYELGAGYWNHFIFRYVPGQWVGPAFKESLMIACPREKLDRELAAMDYVNPPGSTVTGMGDAFQQFGYFGCLFFGALGVLFRNLRRAALDRKALFAQLLYMQSCTCAMRAVTHWTLDFLPGLTYNLLFLGAVAFYAAAAPRPCNKPRRGFCRVVDAQVRRSTGASPTR